MFVSLSPQSLRPTQEMPSSWVVASRLPHLVEGRIRSFEPPITTPACKAVKAHTFGIQYSMIKVRAKNSGDGVYKCEIDQVGPWDTCELGPETGVFCNQCRSRPVKAYRRQMWTFAPNHWPLRHGGIGVRKKDLNWKLPQSTPYSGKRWGLHEHE